MYPKSHIFNITLIKVLNLNDNELTTLPPDIIKLKHLKDLDVGSNEIEEFPIRIKNWFEELEANDCSITYDF